MKGRPSAILSVLGSASVILAACVPIPPPPTQVPERIPLQEALVDMKPQDVWQNFFALTRIPRPSGHVEQVREFLIDFGQGLGLETLVDEVGNVLIRKPAAPGKEERSGIVLQAHMDMVAQAGPHKVYEPITDPIEAYVDGEWLRADGTTLGADDGIGIAMAMAVLQSTTLSAGPIEALFTIDEETTMAGANGLQPGWLRGTTYINLDGEWENTFVIGSAGGATTHITAPYAEMAPQDGIPRQLYRLTVGGLRGGHSGIDIHLGRGNAIKLLARFLQDAGPTHGLRVAQMEGGTAHNAIPRDAWALVLVPGAQRDPFLGACRAYEDVLKQELGDTDPNLAIEVIPAQAPPDLSFMDEQAQAELIAALVATPQDVLAMSQAVPGLVETSSNIGVIRSAGGVLEVTCLTRSSVGTSLDAGLAAIESVWQPKGATLAVTDRYAGWAPNPASPILALMQQIHEDLTGETAEVAAVHAGLECGTAVAKYPGMDAISIGPTMENVHSPDEALNIPSVDRVAAFLLTVLESW